MVRLFEKLILRFGVKPTILAITSLTLITVACASSDGPAQRTAVVLDSPLGVGPMRDPTEDELARAKAVIATSSVLSTLTGGQLVTLRHLRRSILQTSCSRKSTGRNL